MTRTEYMTKLQTYLKRLPREDYEDAIDYFIEYFDECADDETAINNLGTPKEAAHEILLQLYDRKATDQTTKSHNTIWLAILAIFAAPIGLPLALTLVALLITALLLFLSLVLTVASFCIVLFSMGLAGLFAAWELVPLALNSALLFLGGGLASVGASFLLSKGLVALSHQSIQALIAWIHSKLKGGQTHEIA